MSQHRHTLVAALERRFVTVNDDVAAGGRAINVLRPRSAEDLISEDDFDRDERLPYWAELWPSSVVLADFLLTRADAPMRVVELGCGTGLVATAAMLAGHDVLATDYYEDALLFTRANSYRNCGREVVTRLVDWRAMPDDLGTFELVLASDVLYERSYAPLVAGVIRQLVSAPGRAYVADPGRVAAGAFVQACEETGLVIREQASRPFLADTIRQSITIYEITRAA